MNAERIAGHFEIATNIGLYGAALSFRSGMARGIAREQARADAFNVARAAAIRARTARRLAAFEAGRDAKIHRILRSL